MTPRLFEAALYLRGNKPLTHRRGFHGEMLLKRVNLMTKRVYCRVLPRVKFALVFSIITGAFVWLLMVPSLCAQTAPVAQGLPYMQSFGSSPFTSLPPGLASWNGLNGGTISSSSAAAASIPTGDAILNAATNSASTGGTYGLGSANNGRIYIQTSSNATNGANQLALALDTRGLVGVTLSYEIEVVSAQPRTVGVICQYRVGSTGAWSTLNATNGQNPFSQSAGTTGVKTSPLIMLPLAGENQPVVQVRWATWRGTESGNSSGLAIDNITVNGTPLSSQLSMIVNPEAIVENAAANASTVTVTRTGDLSNPLPVMLAVSDTTEAAYDGPNPASMPAGQASVTFALRAVDDQLYDGSQTVTLTASAPGASSASANLTVTDDEDAYSPPPGYYNTASGKIGADLKATLKTISAAGQQTYSYSNTLAPLRAIYEDPANPANVVTVYSGTSMEKSAVFRPLPGIDPDTTWSREHVWPASFGLDPDNVDPGATGGDAGPDYTDLFNLRPAIQTVNAQRGNRFFDESPTSGATVPPLASACSYDSDSWEPRNVEKGDLARAILYMATRYDGSDPKTLDLEVADTPDTSTGRFARLSTLLLWNELDPVSDEERQRNQLTYSSYQHNRNPFIDHPEYSNAVWGNVRLSKLSGATAEGGQPDTYFITLGNAPTGDVVVAISSTPAGQIVSTPSNVTFTAQNWDQPQVIAVSAVNDEQYESTQKVLVRHAVTSTDVRYAVLVPLSVEFTVTDDDPLLAPQPLPLSYGGPWSLLPAGFGGTGLDTYATSLGNDTGPGSVKFDNSGDRLTVAFETAPAVVSYRLKGQPGSGSVTSGTFLVQQSSDGVAFSNVRTITNKDNTDQAFNDPLPLSARYVSFFYSAKSSGNLQFDKLLITAAPAWQAWLAGYGLTGTDANAQTDYDRDGLVNLAEYGLGGSPTISDASAHQSLLEKLAGKLRLTAIVRTNDSALQCTVETNPNLSNINGWSTAGVTQISPVDQTGVPAGFARVIYEVNDGDATQRFVRLRFSLNQ